MRGRKLIKWIGRLIEHDCGATAIEYTLIAALIAVAAVILIIQIGADVSAPFNTIAGNL
jgi:Flp pilus assembly pilin Flp